MDERHWWFATKLQETFHIGALDNPTMLEDFMAEQSTLDYINDFLATEGHKKLFFTCPKPDPNSLITRKMSVTSSCAKLKEVMDENAVCLYFIRSDVNRVIDPTCVEKEVYCGEIKENPLVNFSSLLSEVFVPMLHAQNDWGYCSEEEQQHFMNQIDKYTNTLVEYANATIAPQQILKKPDCHVTTDFKQNRAAAVNPVILQEYENLVLDWISTIEGILIDGLEDRSDITAGPLSELDRWKRRQKLLISVTDQLKNKECKAVIAVLITAKSKVLKRWKVIDASITDALNETKDKVRYLESIRKYLEQMYSGVPLGSICNNTLPGLMASIRQMDSVSRYYARSGYLGLLFSKISNQLVTASKNYLRGSTIVGEEDKLWTKVDEEVESCSVAGPVIPVKTKPKKKAAKDNVVTNEDSFMTRLNSCLSLQKQYRDMLRSLRDSLGGSHSLASVTPSTMAPNKRVVTTACSNVNLMSPQNLSPMRMTQSSKIKGDIESVTSQGSSGIAFTDEESIMTYLDTFCVHVRNLIDIIQTLGQVTKLVVDVKNLMRIPKGTIMNGPPDDEAEPSQRKDGEELLEKTTIQVPSIAGSSEQSFPGEGSLASGEAMLEDNEGDEELQEIFQADHTPSIGRVLSNTVAAMRKQLESAITTSTFVDVEGQGKEIFEECYSGFVASVHKIESYVCNYLKGAFCTKLNIRKALGILTSFNCVINRLGLRAILSEKYLEVFSWFENELEEVQQIYENEKESPPLVRNSPIVAGAITWSRNLLRRIEEPMKIFKENKFVTAYRDFNRIVKFYNRIATALVKFENLWLSLWKSRIDSVYVGLRMTLLAKHPSSNQLIVNADGRVFELIQESKSLQRLGITIPETAIEILKKESRLKKYKQSLELILQDYYTVCSSVPAPLKRLLTPHMESVLHYLQPGLSTLNWNSMNIDAYLHQVHSATDRLKDIVDNINQVLKDGVDRKIKRIQRIILFDPTLAYSKVWMIDRFVETEGRAVKIQAKVLFDLIKDVENALQEIIAISQQRRITSPASPLVTPTPSTSYGADHNGPPTPRLSKIGTILSSASPTRAGTAVSGLTDESVIGDIFGYYCSLVFDSVLVSIVSSLMVFGDCVKPLGRMTSGIQVQASSEEDFSDDLSDFEPSVTSTDLSHHKELLKFEVEIRFNIPDIVIEPSLSVIQDGVNKIATDLVDVSKAIMWWAADVNQSFHSQIHRNGDIMNHLEQLSTVVTSLQQTVDRQLLKFRRYDFLWKDDMHALYHSFIESDPGTNKFKEEVENLQKIEENVESIPDRLNIGSVCLNTSPIKDSLHGFAVAWKLRYSTQLHEEAKIELDKIVTHRNDIYERLSQPVITLDELNSAFQLLQMIGDMENTIDDVYLPVENIYDKLRQYKLNLPRNEVEEVDNLRDEWVKLVDLAEKVRRELLIKKRGMFEQELDKEVKAFVVNVIQFRNSFDTQGPGVSGVRPAEAVIRLHDFQQRYSQYESNRKTLDAVQLLFGIVPTPFPELDKTGEELKLLGQLYGLFQQFNSFDQRFRETLWSEVDLVVANQEMEHYWQECVRLPSRIQGWEAFKEMRDAIKHYLDVFPILHKLNAKEIRNRHWLQVMSVTGSSFQLEAHIFKLVHLLDIGLLEHQDKIQNICQSASRELELELKMRSIEEEWTEQVLSFENFKNRGLVCLSHSNTENLLDVLEYAQATLAIMLTSKYIGPLRDEAAAWALKLKEISEVLEQWLTVQDLWKHLEEVFSNSATAKELPQEYNRFARVDKSYMKMMKRAYETKNVLQCCVGGDVPKIQMLKHLHEELEICFKSLVGFLDSKRRVFPRFCFVTDTVLLAILSKPYNLDSVKPYIRCLFSSVRDITLRETEPLVPTAKRTMLQASAAQWRRKLRDDGTSFTSSKEDQDSTTGGLKVELPTPQPSDHRTSVIPSSLELRQGDADWRNTIPQRFATGVTSDSGETIQFKTQVPLKSSVDVWLSGLLKSIHESLYSDIQQCINDIDDSQSIEEWAGKYPAQVCRLGLLYVWTKECETGIADIRIDRKALPNTTKRFWSGLSKLPNLLAKGTWKHSEGPMPAYHKIRLEALLSQGMYLRDILDDLAKRKLRDVVDFEWKRNIRFYGQGSGRAVGPLPTSENDTGGDTTIQLPPTFNTGTSFNEPFVIHMLDAQLPYGCEFYGGDGGLVLTPVTERCFLTLTQSIWNFSGGALQGSTDTGKTETIKGLAYLLGRYLVTLSCSHRMATAGVAKIIVGLAEEGCWGLMDEFQQVNQEVVSVMLYEIQAILLAMRSGLTSCTIDDGKEINIQPNFSVFLSVSKTSQSSELSPEVRALFRTIAMVTPDVALVLRAHCAGQGFKSHKVIADRLKLVSDICLKQLGGGVQYSFSVSSLVSVIQHAGQKRVAQGPVGSKLTTTNQEYFHRPSSTQSVIPGLKMSQSTKIIAYFLGSLGSKGFGQQKDKKPTTPSALTPAIKMEHAFVVQSLIECIGPRLTPDEMSVFNTILRDVFSGLPRPPAPPYHVTKELEDFESVLLQYTKDKGLVAHHSWIIKISQLRNLSKIHHGIIVAGPPGTGKSSCISALIDTLTECSNIKHKNTGSPVHAHKLQKIYPLGVSDPALMFGRINSNGDFEDAIFTSYWRKANKEHSVHRMTTWLCLDAPLHHGWAETLNSVLDKGQYLNLLNGERLYLSEHVKLLFETDDLSNASPATVARSAIVLMDESVLGWRPLAEAWLANRSPQEVHCLQRAFNKTMDAISQFIQFEARPRMKVCEVGLFSTCLAMVKALIEGNMDIGGELHIERLFLFSLIWSFGSLLDDHDRRRFSEILLSLTTALPDYDQEISVFDYYVDESGEWDTWPSKVPDLSYFDAADLLGEVFVETVNTVRTRMFMELASASGRNILLAGPTGCGKTSMINDFLDKQEDKNHIVKRYVFSGTSKAVSLQRFIENNIHHRQGFVYGAKRGKALNIFIDDLSIPQQDKHGVQEANELLRQILDQEVLFNTKKPFDRRVLEGVVVTSAMTITDRSNERHQQIPDRLKRHFAVFFLPAHSPDSLFTIVNSVLEANMAQNQGMGLPQELHEQIARASCVLINSVQDVLRPSYTPGRYHYQFNLRDITRVFQGLKNCAEEMRADDDYIALLWQHEVLRVLKDRISRASDNTWFEKNLKAVLKEYFPSLPANSPPPLFITFPLETSAYTSRPVTHARAAAPKNTLQVINDINEVALRLQTYLRRYNDEYSEGLDLMVSAHVMYHVVRLHRILSYKNRGNVLLVGAIGTHLASLARLALYMLDYHVHPVDCSYPNTFLDGLRSAVRQAGCDGKTTTVLFTAADLKDDSYLDALNSLLISGEYPPLFSEDELESLLQALMPAIKRKFSSFLADPMKFFITRVKANLHVVLCLQPAHKLLRDGSNSFPGILYGCQGNWVKDWPQYALEGEASHYLAKHTVLDGIDEQSRQRVVSSLSTIHGHALRECHQIPWSGSDNTIRTAASAGDDEADLPLAKNLLLERINLMHQSSDGTALGKIVIGPTTYVQCMHCFRHIFKTKRLEAKRQVEKLSRAVATLDQTRKDAIIIKNVITETKQNLEHATTKSAELLKVLTSKATSLEKLKAKLGIGSSTLSAFTALIDNEIEEDDTTLLYDDEEDELDEEFEKIKEAKMKSRKIKVMEQITTAEMSVQDAKIQLKKAEQLVHRWDSKVDRSLIERLRAFQSPPPMTGMVMVMVMVLLGRPEFAAGIGGAGTNQSPVSRERKNAGESLTGGSHSDEMSRASSATMRRRGVREQSRGSGSQMNLLGVSIEGKVDRPTWKAIQQIMNDSQRFVESLHNLTSKSGLADDILAGVQSFFVTSSGGELGVSDDLNAAAAGASASTYVVPPGGRQSATPLVKAQGITTAAAKYSSEDAAVLAEYAIALVDYTRLYKPYRKAMEFLDELLKEKEEDERRMELELLKQQQPTEEVHVHEPEPELTEADLPGLREEVKRLQDEYDDAVVVKHNLANDVKSCSERLKAATDLLHSLKHIEREWKAYVEEYSSPDVLLANCIAAAVFLTYCGAMGIDQRKRMGKYLMRVCRDNGLPIQARHLFSRLTLAEFLKGKVTLKKWENMSLPTDPLSLDNMCIASQEESSDTWPLLCDPQRIAITWINTMLGQTTTVKYKELRGHLETCLMEGTTLLITDVDVKELKSDTRFYHILQSRYRFLTSKSPFKLMISEHEIECQPGFRLVFATTSPAESVPAGLSAHVNVVEFVQSREGLEELFLDRFLRLEKPRMQETRTQVITEMVTLMEGLHEAEKNILACLGSGHRLLYNLAATKKLASIKRLHDETLESQMRSRGIENSILQSREGYRPIALRAAVTFDVSRVMAKINSAYQTSLSQFLLMFDAAITHSERTAVKAVVERLGHSAFYTTARSLFEQDRSLFALLTALEVEDSAYRLGAGDREFLIHPTYGATVKAALNPTLVSESASRTQGKKPFDWMLDEQFANLQLLAQHFEWFQDPFDKMAKDGRETQWRQITEHDKPELVTLPDGLDEKYTAIQRFMVIRALRGDRLLPAATCFITSVLGKRYTGDLPLDLPTAYRQSDCRRPIVLLYTREANMVEKIVIEGAQRKQVELHVVALSNSGGNEERMARKLIHKSMVQGSWVLLHNAHNTPRLLAALDSFMQETKTVDPEFRLWVSVQPNLDIPSSLLQTAVKIVADSPQSTKESLHRSLSWIDNELLRVSNRPEWPPLLHNLCMLHSVVRLRCRYRQAGWNKPEDFVNVGTGELWQALDLAVREFQDTADLAAAAGNTVRSIQWNGLRYMLTEVVYGSCISDEFDRQGLSAMIDYWVSPAAVKREFEAAKTRYKLPSAFFGGHVRSANILTAIESISGDILEIPEACGLHTSPETHLPNAQYVFTRLNLLLDHMAATDTLTHAVSDPSAIAMTSGVILHSSSAQTIGGGAVCLAEVGVFASASMVALRSRKDVDLNELCLSLLTKLPKVWNKESVYERMKKVGGATPFNLFVLAEVDSMSRLLATVRETLLAIKVVTDDGVYGDQLSDDILQVADDLYHSRIPDKWTTMAGDVTPPCTWTLASWFTDLSNRFTHIDRIVVQGRDRVPAYWLGAFFNPRRLLSIIKQEAVRIYEGKSSSSEPYVFQTEITGRDKDHLREPPLDGIFVYGIYLWGCAWEKTTGDLLDAPPRYGPTPLPVVHITAVPQTEKASLNDPVRAAVSYSCPCYPSRISVREPVMLLDVDNKDITGTRWPLRGLSSTLRPF